MAIQILPILKALAPLVANASGVVANLKSKSSTADSSEKLERLEREAIQAGELLAATAAQLEALAQQLEVQAELNDRYERRTKWALALAVVSSVLCLGTLVAAIV
ncbi:hypothetical protein [Pelagicoccus sp. SDUM812002]|uniref:hypothetical protein n=1 Tax=Pelagicoccus sp. SDUM812002 TaxID=3041266 RepID=UPI00280DBD18|nr:hypothetical protein [Pelagicoccus sp. SDUM812002]MDQ8188293.1 hypothetical protein [Pelagicoccus sp. SDUM812002]